MLPCRRTARPSGVAPGALTGAHQQRGQRAVAGALVGAAPEAALAVTAVTPARLLPRGPARKCETRLGPFGMRGAELEHTGLVPRGGVTAETGWAAGGHAISATRLAAEYAAGAFDSPTEWAAAGVKPGVGTQRAYLTGV
jgi:hypothetical protein